VTRNFGSNIKQHKKTEIDTKLLNTQYIDS